MVSLAHDVPYGSGLVERRTEKRLASNDGLLGRIAYDIAGFQFDIDQRREDAGHLLEVVHPGEDALPWREVRAPSVFGNRRQLDGAILGKALEADRLPHQRAYDAIGTGHDAFWHGCGNIASMTRGVEEGASACDSSSDSRCARRPRRVD